jgi:hypothetical protein
VTEPAREYFANSLSAPLEARGFCRRSIATWVRRTSESLLLIDVQEGLLLDDVYVNLGAYYNELGALTDPEIGWCHVRVRLNPQYNRRHLESALQ